jgi:hypothetical protein
MFGLGGTPHLPDARWALTMLALVGLVVLGLRYPARRTRGWQIGLVLAADCVLFVLAITGVGAARLLPRLFAP